MHQDRGNLRKNLSWAASSWDVSVCRKITVMNAKNGPAMVSCTPKQAYYNLLYTHNASSSRELGRYRSVLVR